MSVSTELLVYSSKLRQAEYAEGWGGTPELEAAVEQCVYDRLALAQAFLAAAQAALTTAQTEVDYRNIISRSYYVCHHAIRACLMHRNNGDVDGHTEAIVAFNRVLATEPFLRSRLASCDLLAFMHRRHLADYYAYGASYPREAALDFASRAPLDVQEAQLHLEAVIDFIRSRGGRVP